MTPSMMDPLMMLLDKHQPHQPDNKLLARENPYYIRLPANLPGGPLKRATRPYLPPYPGEDQA